MPEKKLTGVFDKKDFSVVPSDWTGSESYWSVVSDKVYTTNVGSSDPEEITIRYIQSRVDAGEITFDLDFPDSDEWRAGNVFSYSNYPSITRREVHIFDKIGSFPNRFRIDVYNGTTLLCQYYVFRDFSDYRVFKYGLRIRHLVAPSGFELEWDVSDDSAFSEFGISIAEAESDYITDESEVVGKTYYFSIPTAYLPEGRALLGGANDSSARVMALAALAIAVIGIIYVVMFVPGGPSASASSKVKEIKETKETKETKGDSK
jgi:hypothetical protein